MPSGTKSLIWWRESHNPLPAGIVEDESPISEGVIFLEFHMEDVFLIFVPQILVGFSKLPASIHLNPNERNEICKMPTALR